MSVKIALPIPAHFDSGRVGEVWRVPYGERAQQALDWAKANKLQPAASDRVRIALMIVDVQNTFCIPDFELFVGGRSGKGAVEDNVRLCEFIYRNLGTITQVFPTMDTHTAMQIFHPAFWVNNRGENPPPFTLIQLSDIQKGVWSVNPAVAASIANGHYSLLAQHVSHYAKKLSEGGKYALTIWPYHGMLGGIGHALVSAMEEAVFFHNLARSSQTGFEIKGGNALTENYSVLKPEVLEGPGGISIAQRNTEFIKKLLSFDYVVIAGQAKSHCVAWTIADLLDEIVTQDPDLARKVYLLEDCTSSVVVPGVIDYTDEADKAFQRFANAGMHVVRSVDPIEKWPNIKL